MAAGGNAENQMHDYEQAHRGADKSRGVKRRQVAGAPLKGKLAEAKIEQRNGLRRHFAQQHRDTACLAHPMVAVLAQQRGIVQFVDAVNRQ